MSYKLWAPSEEKRESSVMKKYLKYLKENKDSNFNSYMELYDWSIKDRDSFWESIWEFSGIIHSKKYDKVLSNGEDMLNSKWFVGAKLNFAQNLLKKKDSSPAIISFSESLENEEVVTYKELFEKVSALSNSLDKIGLKVGDRVSAFMPNIPETIIAMLATTSIGGIWSSCSVDSGTESMIERFSQINPKILFTTDSYYSKGKKISLLEKISSAVKKIPSIEKVIIFSLDDKIEIKEVPNTILYKNLLSENKELKFKQLPFDHPVYILYTSGTTAKPKCIVHGAGGTLLQHFKELALHSDVKENDRIYYTTTCGWVLWNWMTSALMLGATILLRDGSPFYPYPDILFALAEKKEITHFGASARYFTSLSKLDMTPAKKFNLENLRVIMYGGSALSPEGFEYIYKNVKKDVMISSMAGGTEIVSCFAIGNPLSEVWAGEIQGWGLGMNCRVFDSSGNSLRQKKGELVCTSSFPSQPLKFWEDEKKEKYKNTYFNKYPNVWKHGDYAEITERGTVIIYGRSDATLNPGGVRIGTSEIYQALEPIKEIEDSIAVSQNWDNDSRIVLFVKLISSETFTKELARKIRNSILKNTTPNHVPAKIIPVEDIPYTINGKKMELTVKNLINGDEPEKEAISNPESLRFYRDIEELRS
ncbi:acetoacetate--CoA ligase [Candidatus Pacearchaeota archaeon]|nr:acetoacetate--CoA ligase [Candidatus Pacearchaeota archaeon]